MKKNYLPLKVCIIVSLFIASCSEPDKPSFSDSAMDQVLRGKEIFTTQCTACHGKLGDGGMNGAKNLQTSVLSTDQMLRKVSTGGNGMPAFNGTLGEASIRDVVAYIRTLHK
jgi:mono/diheme cytochrome c family protein